MAFIPSVKSKAVGMNLTPMIDVTFQLLIFFVCANTWSHAESSERLELPAPIQSGVGPAEDRPRLTINLRPDGGLSVMGRPADIERLTRLLVTEQRRHGAKLEVMIRAHRDTPYARTREIFQACTTVGIPRIRFAVLREE